MRSILSTVIALALALPIGAEATILNSVSLANGGGGSPGCGSAPSKSFSETGTINANLNDGEIGCTMTLDGYAGGGAVGVRGTLNHVPGGTTNSQIAASARSSMTAIYLTPLFDVKDPDEAFNTNFSVGVIMNAVVGGTLSSILDTQSGFGRAGGNGIKATATFSGTSEPGNQVSVSQDYFASSGAFNSGPGSAFADSEIVDGVFNLSLVLDWRFPLSVIFNLSADVSAASGGDSNVTSTFDVFNTMSFSESGPAFTVPEGFTVNAPELNILDNVWTDPRPSTVPVPAAAWLFGSAMLGLVGLARRKKA